VSICFKSTNDAFREADWGFRNAIAGFPFVTKPFGRPDGRRMCSEAGIRDREAQGGFTA